MRPQAKGARTASIRLRTSAGEGRRGRPATSKVSSSKPASGTSRASTRSGDPANVTRTPCVSSSSATASDGSTWPAVPPAAIRHRSSLFRCTATGDVKEDPDGQEHHDQRGAAVGDERQGNPGQRGKAQDGRQVDHRLPGDERHEPGRETFSERVLTGERNPQSRVREEGKRSDDGGDAE